MGDLEDRSSLREEGRWASKEKCISQERKRQ